MLSSFSLSHSIHPNCSFPIDNKSSHNSKAPYLVSLSEYSPHLSKLEQLPFEISVEIVSRCTLPDLLRSSQHPALFDPNISLHARTETTSRELGYKSAYLGTGSHFWRGQAVNTLENLGGHICGGASVVDRCGIGRGYGRLPNKWRRKRTPWGFEALDLIFLIITPTHFHHRSDNGKTILIGRTRYLSSLPGGHLQIAVIRSRICGITTNSCADYFARQIFPEYFCQL